MAVAEAATSTGSPAGTVSDGGGADELGSSAADEDGGAGSSLVSWEAETDAAGDSVAESSSSGESSSQMPPTATRSSISATSTHGSQAGTMRRS